MAHRSHPGCGLGDEETVLEHLCEEVRVRRGIEPVDSPGHECDRRALPGERRTVSGRVDAEGSPETTVYPSAARSQARSEAHFVP